MITSASFEKSRLKEISLEEEESERKRNHQFARFLPVNLGIYLSYLGDIIDIEKCSSRAARCPEGLEHERLRVKTAFAHYGRAGAIPT